MKTILVVAMVLMVSTAQAKMCVSDSDCGSRGICVKKRPYDTTGQCVQGYRNSETQCSEQIYFKVNE